MNEVCFPKTKTWETLARALKGTLDEEELGKLAEFHSNPFTPGEHRRAAIRVIDDSARPARRWSALTSDGGGRPRRVFAPPDTIGDDESCRTVGGARSRR